MSLKKNILASYFSQIYVTLIGIITLPLYLKYMGAEAYGLVGFFTMLQAIFQLLDMGLTPTMARETARFNGGTSDAVSLRRLLRALEGVFIGTAVLGCATMVASSNFISISWLNVQKLPLEEVQSAVKLMAVIVALRWISGLYRSAITGFERLVWLSGFNIAISTARFIFVIPFFIYVGTSPTQFFAYQLLVAICEIAILATKTYYFLPKKLTNHVTAWEWAPLQSVLKFSFSMAVMAGIWILITQIDKIILSKLLPLADYGYFTLAVLAASGVLMISGPISTAVLPRMTRLQAENNEVELINIYHRATRMVATIAIPTALILTFFAEKILWAWTGNLQASSESASILKLYSLGNGLLVLAAFPYYLQFAKGNLRLHIIGSVFLLTLLTPALIWSTLRFGAIGAGYAWLISNTIYFIAWTPLVHRRFLKNLHKQWLIKDLAPIFFSNLLFVILAKIASPPLQERFEILINLIVIVFFISSINFLIIYSKKSNSKLINEH